MKWRFWERTVAPSKAPLLPMELRVSTLPSGMGAVLQVFLDENQELVFVLSKPGIVRLVDALLEAGLGVDDE